MERGTESKGIVSDLNYRFVPEMEQYSIYSTRWYKVLERQCEGLRFKYFIDSFIQKVPFESLIQYTVAYGSSHVFFLKVNNTSYLLMYYHQTVSKILDNGLLVIYNLISNISYTEVGEYRKIVIYNHAKVPHISYQNHLDIDIDNGFRHIIAVWNYKNHIYDILEKVIPECENEIKVNENVPYLLPESSEFKVIDTIYVDNQIKQVSLEYLVKMAIVNDHKSLRFLELEGKRYLINYNTKSQSKKMDNGNLISKTVIFNVHYCEVKEYKRFIIYDHFKAKHCQYISNLEHLIKKTSTYIVLIRNYESRYLEILKNVIKKEINLK